MAIKMKDILNFKTFYQSVEKQKLPIKTAYKFAKYIKELESEVVFYQTKMREILEKYGEKNTNGEFIFVEEGKSIQIKEVDIPVCQQELNDLENMEVDITTLNLSLDELEGIVGTIEEASYLLPFLEV